MSQPKLRLVESGGSGDGGGPGNHSGGGTGSSGGGHAVDIAGLQKNVGFLNWAAGIVFVIGLSAIVGSYLMLANRIDDRYDKIGDKLDRVTEQISNVRVSISEVKSDDQSQTGPRKRQARSIH